ncbi:hypothetical protein J3F84DRAFT_375974 [Trichoderma pleuroticola]
MMMMMRVQGCIARCALHICHVVFFSWCDASFCVSSWVSMAIWATDSCQSCLPARWPGRYERNILACRFYGTRASYRARMVRGFRQRCGNEKGKRKRRGKTGPWSDVRGSDDAKESHPGLVMRSYGRALGGHYRWC